MTQTEGTKLRTHFVLLIDMTLLKAQVVQRSTAIQQGCYLMQDFPQHPQHSAHGASSDILFHTMNKRKGNFKKPT